MVEITKEIPIINIDGGLVHFFKMPSDCKVIKNVLITTDIYHFIDTSAFSKSYFEEIEVFFKRLKDIHIGNVSLQINNAVHNLIIDYPLFIVQKRIGKKTSLFNYRERVFDALQISNSSFLNLDVDNEYIKNTMCKLTFKYNDILPELKKGSLLPNGLSLYKDISENFNLFFTIKYEEDGQ